MTAGLLRPRCSRHGARIRWLLRAAGFLAVLVYLRLVGLDGKFYYPDKEVYSRPEEYGLSYDDIAFETRDGLRLHGWLLHATGAPRGVVVHFHGNAANISAHLGLIDWLPRLGYHTLMFDYRGYGKSPGHVTRTGTVWDGHAAVEEALRRARPDNLPVYFYGQSLGAAVAIVVAGEYPEVRAVVAESPFSSYRRIAALHARRLVGFDFLARLLARGCISDGYDPIAVVDRLSPRPLLVIVAGEDHICPPELAHELYQAARAPKQIWEVPQAQHLEVAVAARAELARRVDKFFGAAALAH